jgi:hypothetical protein
MATGPCSEEFQAYQEFHEVPRVSGEFMELRGERVVTGRRRWELLGMKTSSRDVVS